MLNLFERDQLYILNTYKRNNLHIKKGKGAYLYDTHHQKYLDMYAGIAVSSLGHRHKRLNRAIKKQISKHAHLSNYFVSEPVVGLAEMLVKSSFGYQVFFTNSGTEAIEASIKLVRKYGRMIHPDKTEIITLSKSFHGRTMGALSLTGQPKYQAPFGPLLNGVIHVDRNDVDSLHKVASEKTCAIYVEIIQGEGGIVMLSDAFIEAIHVLQKKHDILVVVDEIQTGIMRTGKMFAYMHTQLKPDLMTLAKSLGGGLPLGALVVSKPLKDVLKPGDHGTTFGGNPVAAAAGLETFKVLSDPHLQEQVVKNSEYLFSKLEAIKASYGIIQAIRGKGLMIGVDVGSHAHIIMQKALNQHVLLNVTSETVIRLLPPLNIKMKEIHHFLKVFEGIIKEISE